MSAVLSNTENFIFKNESILNFSEPQTRKLMEAALNKVRSQFGKLYSLQSGEVIGETKRQKLQSLNPSKPSEVVGYTECASIEDAQVALQQMSAYYPTWKKTTPLERARLLFKLADWMTERRYELSAWMVLEVGKSWREADGDTVEAIDFCRFYAIEMLRLAEPQVTQSVPGERDLLKYYPKGVALVIAPWNFPLAILTGMTVAALVTGNTVIIKPAEQSSVIATFLARGLKESGFPQEAFYFLPGRGEEIGPMLVSDPRVDIITFTGSVDVGLSIIESAAKKPKPGQRGVKKVIAEMGGKNALIVDEDADLDEAILGALHSAFGFQGQKCSAMSRLLVHEKVKDVFVKRLVDAVASLKIGNAEDPQFQVGPVIDEEAQKRILATIEKSKSRLKVLYQAKDIPSQGYYVAPTLFEVTDIQDELFQNEVFGPVVAVKSIKNLEEGVKDLNSVPFGLTGGIYSRSPKHIQWITDQLEVGNLYINRAITGAIVERHPFGGCKMSGCGAKAGGKDYLLQFMEAKTISENTVRRGFAGE